MAAPDDRRQDEVQVIPQIHIEVGSGLHYSNRVRETQYLIPVDEWELQRNT